MNTQKNGTTAAPKISPVKDEKKVETTVALLPVVSLKAEPGEPLPALDDRLLRLNQLFELQKKYSRLQDSKLKLAGFNLNKASENITLTIEDAKNDFSTTNAVVIEEVLQFVAEAIDRKIADIAAKLHW